MVINFSYDVSLRAECLAAIGFAPEFVSRTDGKSGPVRPLLDCSRALNPRGLKVEAGIRIAPPATVSGGFFYTRSLQTKA
jgi:hypothetical protein